MTNEQIAYDVERGLEIRAEMKKLKAELDAIEERLEQAGLEGEQIPLEDDEREGRQFIASSMNHCVPVRFESDLLVGQFLEDSPLHLKIAGLAGDHLGAFYKRTCQFKLVPKDGKEFRRVARALLDPAVFASLIHICTARDKKGIAKSKTVIGWDDVKEA